MRIALCLFLIHLSAFAQQSIGFNQELIPYELELLVKHLERFPHSEKKSSYLEQLKIINQDLALANKEETFLLFKSEIYKNILDNESLRVDANAIRVTGQLIKNVNDKLDKNKLIYSDFSQWIILSITSDLNEFIDDGFLDKAENINRNNEKDMLRLGKLNKMLTYLSPWLEVMTRLTPQQFNQFVTVVADETIDKIVQRTSFFQNFSLKLESREVQTLFNLPLITPQESPATPTTEQMPPGNLEEASNLQKEEAQKNVESLEVDPEKASEIIDSLPLEEEGQQTQWQPE